MNLLRLMTLACAVALLAGCSERSTPVAAGGHPDKKAGVTAVENRPPAVAPELRQWEGLGAYSDFRTVYARIGSETPFSEGTDEKKAVLVRLTPAPPEAFDCHSCYPLLGVAVYVRRGSGWELEGKSRVIGYGQQHTRLSVVRIGAHKSGLLLTDADVHQGYENLQQRLLVPEGSELSMALDVKFSEKPGPGACEEAADQSLVVTFEESGKEYFDATVESVYNEGPCDDGLVQKKERTRYEFVGGRYVPAGGQARAIQHAPSPIRGAPAAG